MPTQRYMLTLAYDGSAFHGWQEQKPAEPGAEPLRTVQGVMIDAARRTLAQPIHIQGASRTDAGVHALGQVAHLDADTRIPVERLAEALTSRLPDDVEVRHARIAADDFDARRDAVSKQYRYRLWLSPQRPLDRRLYVYPVTHPLDERRMKDAARRLIGEHDFAAFAAAKDQRLTSVRTIHDCRIERHEPAAPGRSPELHIVVAGDGFLYNMVRIIAGTLVEVGRGKLEPTLIDHLLAVKDRTQAGPTLPPNGLCLEWIRYPAEKIHLAAG